MNISKFFIDRPIFAGVLSVLILLAGLLSAFQLPIAEYPEVVPPSVVVRAQFPGANPKVIAETVAAPLEESINGVESMLYMQSQANSDGNLTLTVHFQLGVDPDKAQQLVQNRVSQALPRLPEDVQRLGVTTAKSTPTITMVVHLTSPDDRYDMTYLRNYAVLNVKDRLARIKGVGEVGLFGSGNYAMRVWLDPGKVAERGLTAPEIVKAIREQNVQVAAGVIGAPPNDRHTPLQLNVNAQGRLKDEAEFAQIILKTAPDGGVTRLGDVARIEDDLADKRQLARFNGQTTVGLGMVKIANANTVAITERIQERVDTELRPALPPGMSLSVVSNDAVFIIEIVDSLKEHLIEGTLLAALVVWVFLRSVRSTLIISLAIPVSLAGAIAVIYFAGFTLNSLTMLGLLLLIGVVVDDAIVVLENIFRHRETLDPDPVSAAINGSNEVVFAVMAATLSLVCIFAPVAFISGIIGQFFRSFALVVTFGVLVSLFVSLTLTPMLCSRYLKVEKQHGPIYRAFDRFFAGLDALYVRLLDGALSHRLWVVLATVAVVASSGFFFANVGKAFAPDADEGRFLVSLRTPLGSSIDYTDAKLREVEAILDTHPEIRSEFSLIGLGAAGQVNQGTVVVRMAPRGERTLKQQDVIPMLRQEFTRIAGARVFAAPYPMVQGARGEPLQFVLTGTNLQELGQHAQALQRKLAALPALGRIDTDLQLDLPQLIFSPDRLRIADAGLATQDVALAINMLTGGVDIAKFNDEPGDGQRYDIRVKAVEGSFTQPADLSKIYLRNKAGEMVRLDSVASFHETLGPAVVGRFDLQYATTFFATPTLPLAEAVELVKATAAEMLPTGYQVRMIGQAEEFGKTQKYMSFTFLLALTLLYMVLASQFNSFLQPAIVMLAQPLAIVGGVAALWATGQTLNIYSMIGLVLLIGLVAKNSILLVDLTNQRRTEGLRVDAALRNACPIRMRPVLMTSMTVILALAPAALGFGAGNETNQPLAIAVIGGMISSTLLTLVVVPAVYSLVEGWRERRQAGVKPAA